MGYCHTKHQKDAEQARSQQSPPDSAPVRARQAHQPHSDRRDHEHCENNRRCVNPASVRLPALGMHRHAAQLPQTALQVQLLVQPEGKQAEEKLRTKEQVFDTSIAANSIADPEGIINEVNPAFLQTWGFISEEEVLGKKITYFLQNEEKAAEIVKSLNKEGVWEGTNNIRTNGENGK